MDDKQASAAVAHSIDKLDGTLRLPITPIYDESGKLIAAQRSKQVSTDEPAPTDPRTTTLNPTPSDTVVPAPEQKFFNERDTEFLSERMKKDRVEAWAEPDAHNPVTFSKAWIQFIGASINRQVLTVVMATKRHLAERDAKIEEARNFTNRRADQLASRIDAAEKQIHDRDARIDDLTRGCAKQALTVESLERRASRQAEHLRHLEDRMQSIEKSGGR